MDIIKDYIIFDDIDSRDYDIEIFFQDIDRTPKRVYSKIEVPGRNGAVIIDEGRYEDVPVIYGCVALNDADRSAFVNALASKINYFRLKDSFNPSEFYSAVFEGDVDPRLTPERDRSVFSISFTRKPERWLTDGEEHISVTSGQLIENPTMFDASPLLEVEGYGTIEFNGYEIELENNVVGEVVLAGNTTSVLTSLSINYNTDLLNVGDDIVIGDIVVNADVFLSTTGAVSSLTDSNNEFTSVGATSGSDYNITTTLPSFTRTKGSAYTYKSNTVTVSGTDFQGNSSSATCLIRVWAYDDRVTVSLQKETVSGRFYYNTKATTVNQIIGNSTMSTLGHPTYIDCDLGEAYKFEDGTPVSLNAFIDLGSSLPKFASGANEITADNTITELKVTPRWWKI